MCSSIVVIGGCSPEFVDRWDVLQCPRPQAKELQRQHMQKKKKEKRRPFQPSTLVCLSLVLKCVSAAQQLPNMFDQ